MTTAIIQQAVVKEAEEIALAAEAILWDLPDGTSPSADQLLVLRRAGLEKREDIEREIGRLRRVKRLLSEAGTAAEFLAAERAALEAARADREQRPELETKLSEIQKQLDELTRARQQAERTLHKFNTNRRMLSEPRMMPRHVREAYEADRHVAEETNGPRIRELEGQLRMIEGLGRIIDDPLLNNLQKQQRMMLHLESAAPDLISHKPNGNAFVDGNIWRQYVQRLESKRPELEDELQELVEERQAKIAALDNSLKLYVNRIE